MTHTPTPPPHPMTTTTEQGPDLGPDWHYAGSVAVDTGEVLILDSCADPPPLEWITHTQEGYAEVALSTEPGHTAIACRTAMGDGRFPVYVRMAPSPLSGGMVPAELRVVFLEPGAEAD